MTQTYFIYKLTCTINNKLYIGASQNPTNRLKQHRCQARNGSKSPVHRAMRKHGVDTFQMEVLFGSPDKDYLFNEMEPYFIALYEGVGPKGYNATPGGQKGPPKGFKKPPMSEETRRKMSEAGRMRMTPEMREHLSKKVRASMTDEMREHNRLMHLGKKATDETRKKLSAQRMGNTNTLGFKQSQETIELRRPKLIGNKSRTGQTQSPEEVAKRCLSDEIIDTAVLLRLQHMTAKEISDTFNSYGWKNKRHKEWTPKNVASIFERLVNSSIERSPQTTSN